jgi:hypothetical protein
MSKLFERFQSLNEKSGYIIDIGAAYGPGPVYPFLKSGFFSGLCIEADPGLFGHLCSNLPSSSISKHNGFATPETILDIFSKYKVPISPDILKIDIDGYDLSVIRTILSKYKPKIIVAEINEKVPPPVYFEVKYDSKYEWDHSHFFGFSLQAGYETLAPEGYIVDYLEEGNNVVCIHKDYLKIEQVDIREIYKRDYLNVPGIIDKYPWNKDIHHWNTLIGEPLLKDINDYFTTERKMRGQNNLGIPISKSAFVLK